MRHGGKHSWVAIERDMVRIRLAAKRSAVFFSWDREKFYEPATLTINVGSTSLTLTARLRRHSR